MVFLLCFLASCCLYSTPEKNLFSPQKNSNSPITVISDVQGIDEQGRMLFKGQVHAYTKAPLHLTSHLLYHDPSTHLISAHASPHSSIIIEGDRFSLYADKLYYDTQLHTLKAVDVSCNIPRGFIHAQEALRETDGRWQFSNFTFTNCHKQTPEWSVRGEQAFISPDQTTLKLRKPSFFLKEYSLLTLPFLKLSLRPSHERKKEYFLPRITMGEKHGLGIRTNYQFRLPQGGKTKLGISGWTDKHIEASFETHLEKTKNHHLFFKGSIWKGPLTPLDFECVGNAEWNFLQDNQIWTQINWAEEDAKKRSLFKGKKIEKNATAGFYKKTEKGEHLLYSILCQRALHSLTSPLSYRFASPYTAKTPSLISRQEVTYDSYISSRKSWEMARRSQAKLSYTHFLRGNWPLNTTRIAFFCPSRISFCLPLERESKKKKDEHTLSFSPSLTLFSPPLSFHSFPSAKTTFSLSFKDSLFGFFSSAHTKPIPLRHTARLEGAFDSGILWKGKHFLFSGRQSFIFPFFSPEPLSCNFHCTAPSGQSFFSFLWDWKAKSLATLSCFSYHAWKKYKIQAGYAYQLYKRADAPLFTPLSPHIFLTSCTWNFSDRISIEGKAQLHMNKFSIEKMSFPQTYGLYLTYGSDCWQCFVGTEVRKLSSPIKPLEWAATFSFKFDSACNTRWHDSCKILPGSLL